MGSRNASPSLRPARVPGGGPCHPATASTTIIDPTIALNKVMRLMSFTHLSLTQRLAPQARLIKSPMSCLCRLIHGFLPRVSCSFLPLRSGYARSMPPLPKRTMRGRFLIVGYTVDEEERIQSFLPFVREGVKNAIVICSDATSERVLPKEREG